MKFSVSHARDAAFTHDGLRPFFEYRDLGIREATQGKVVAHVIRARPGAPRSISVITTRSSSSSSTCCAAGSGSSTKARARCC